jgi:hypothetical protein
MIKALSLAAALAVLPVSAAASDPQGPSEAAIEAAAERFEARMESFGERAELISDDDSLSAAQREARIMALWAEYQPDIDAFTAVVSEHAATIAGEALANVDVDAVVATALAEVEASGALAIASGVAANGAWASDDPEHLATYGLVAEYAMGEALDAIDEAEATVQEIQSDLAEDAADEADEADEVDEGDAR